MQPGAVKYYSTLSPTQVESDISSHSGENSGYLALVAESDRENIPALQSVFDHLELPLIGAVFPELVSDAHLRRNGLLLMHFEAMPNYSIIRNISDPTLELEEQIDKLLETERQETLKASDKNTLMLIFDAMVPNIASILERLYLHLGDQVHYMGVNAGSESFQSMPCLFDNKQLVEDSLLAIRLPHHDGAILEHGYTAPDKMIAATSTQGNRIVSINWQPAFQVYTELVLNQYHAKVNKDNFYEYAVHFPFGIVRADGEVLVRIPVALEDDGSLFCVGEVPENAILTLLKAEDADTHKTVGTIAQHYSYRPPRNMLTFYCAGRRMHMGHNEADAEIAALQSSLKSTNVMGALSLGEIGSSSQDGYPLFHNATLLCTEWDVG